MHKRTLNIASVCFVALIIVFAITRKHTNTDIYTNNIQTDGDALNTLQSASDAYRDEVLKTVLDQSLKVFESTSESFKKKPTDTLSDTIAKNTFSEYIKYNTTDTFDISNIQTETLKALKDHPAERSTVGMQNILVTRSSISNLKDYVNNISVIQTELAKSIYAIRNKEHKEFYIKNLYNTAANLYIQTTVPESLAKEHLNIINGYKNYSIGFQLLELQNTDPAKALGGVQLAAEAQNMLVSSFVSIKKIVLLNNIIYTKKDPAYIWFIDNLDTEKIKLN